MASTAISAQGTALSIGTGSGSPVTVTGVTVGNPTLIAATAHGFNNGDRVTFAALTGTDAGLLNGQTFTVKYKTTNAFAIDIDTTGKTITPGAGTATPITFTAINNIHDFTAFDGAASEIDRSNLQSTAKEFILGLVDPGQCSMNLASDQNDPGQQALRAKQQSGVISNFKLVLPGAGANLTYTFMAYVKKFDLKASVDAKVDASCDLRISGPVTLS